MLDKNQLLQDAAIFAAKYHEGTPRKNDIGGLFLPYIVHPMEVAKTLWGWGVGDPDVLAAACAIGWCPKVFPKLCKWDSDGEVMLKSASSLNRWSEGSFKAAEEMFGLTDRQCVYLFDPGSYPRGNKTTAKQVAKRIRAFVKKIPAHLIESNEVLI